MNKHTILVAAAAIGGATLLSACAQKPLYAPQASERASGYAEQRLDRNNYRVTFTGRRTTSRQKVEDALMLRAAEVTRAAGYTHFIVDARDVAQEQRGASPAYVGGPGFGFYSRWGWGWGRRGWYDPFWYDMHTYYDADRNARYVASANISMLTPEEARANPRAIAADEVIANLGAKVAPEPAR